jgi:ankyrin repeat protein
MEPIHHAAYDGDAAAIDRLVAEDGRRLNAQIQGDGVRVDDEPVTGYSRLMLAAWEGHNAAVTRLLALGADMGLTDARGYTAAHHACYGGDHSSVLALLLDAGASINASSNGGWTPLIVAASRAHPLRGDVD